MAPRLLALCFFSLVAGLVFAQGDYVINKIDIPTADNGTATTKAGKLFLSFVNATIASGFDYSSHKGSYELMAGEKGASDSSVVDIMCVNQDSFVLACSYTFHASAFPGAYHFRVNITNDGGNTALSDTFQITRSSFDCLTPPPPKFNITSTNDPNYRSLVITSPAAGDVSRLGAVMFVSWGYVDDRNAGNANITNLTFELVSETTGRAFESQVADSDALFTHQTAFTLNSTGLSPGAWRVRGNYSNAFENGGQTVSAISDVFYIEGSDETKFCDGLGQGSKSGELKNFETSTTQRKGQMVLWFLGLLMWFY